MTYNIFRLISFLALLIGIANLPYGYYVMLRFLVCGVSVYGAYISSNINNKFWLWTLGIIALLFNPIIPIHMDKESWVVIDFITAVIMLVSIFFIKDKNN